MGKSEFFARYRHLTDRHEARQSEQRHREFLRKAERFRR